MAKYIELQTAIDFVKNNTPTLEGVTTLGCVERALYNAPKADVEEVVRCKDCKWAEYGKDYEPYCNHWKSGLYANIKDDDFCSYGERREGE